MSYTVTIGAVDLVLRVAQAAIGASEVPAGSNAGPFVERVLARTGNAAGDPWCAAWVYDVGQLALAEVWPAPKTAGCQTLADWAQRRKVRYLAKAGAQRGDLFLLWNEKLNRFAHVGFVLAVNKDGTIETCEGNTTRTGKPGQAADREGWVVASKTRKLGDKDRLIRWVALLK